ncbi:hypothetical protein PGB90_004124 [Kerria lacca]
MDSDVTTRIKFLLESSDWPSVGIYSGMLDHLGNWDECVLISSYNIKGQYCLAQAKYTLTDISLHKPINITDKPSEESSVWSAIEMYLIDPVRVDRHKLNWAMCIPSSCKHTDLLLSLNKTIQPIFKKYGLNVSLNVDPIFCQILDKENVDYPSGYYYISILYGVMISIVIAASIYDLTTKDKLKKGERRSTSEKLFQSFSVISNFKKLLHYSPGTDYAIMHFVKILNIILIIYGHRFIFFIGYPKSNSDEAEECLVVSWYISADIQLAIVGSVLLFIATRNRKIGIYATVFAFVIFSGITFTVAYVNKFNGILRLYMSLLEEPRRTKEFTDFYIATYTRAGPYLVGFFAAYVVNILRERNYSFSNKQLYFFIGLSTLIGEGSQFYGCLFYLFGREYNPTENAIFAAFNRSLFVFPYAVAFCIYFTSGLGIFQTLFEKRIFVPLGRLTYSVFLVNTVVQLTHASSQRTVMPSALKLNLYWLALADVAFSYMFGLLLYLFFEAPITNISKLLQRGLNSLFTKRHREDSIAKTDSASTDDNEKSTGCNSKSSTPEMTNTKAYQSGYRNQSYINNELSGILNELTKVIKFRVGFQSLGNCRIELSLTVWKCDAEMNNKLAAIPLAKNKHFFDNTKKDEVIRIDYKYIILISQKRSMKSLHVNVHFHFNSLTVRIVNSKSAHSIMLEDGNISNISSSDFQSNTLIRLQPSKKEWITKIFLEAEMVFDMDTNVSLDCKRDYELFKLHLRNQSIWAVRMSEASEWPSVGVFAGMTYHMGNWDECLKAAPSNFKGQYCLSELNYNFAVDNEVDLNVFNWMDWPQENLSVWSVLKMYERDPIRVNRQTIFWAICIPSSCQARDLKLSLYNILYPLFKKFNVNVNVNVDRSYCHVRVEHHLPMNFYLTLLFFAGSFFFASLITLFDILKKRTGKERIHVTLLRCLSFKKSYKSFTEFSLETSYPLVHLLKIICAVFVLIGHRIMIYHFYPIFNAENHEMMAKVFQFELLQPFFMVDVFFTISGYLMFHYCFTPLKKLGFKYLAIYIIFRWLRMIFIPALVILFNVSVTYYLGDGPFWDSFVVKQINACKTNWWATLLAINNIVRPHEPCLAHTWYISVDTQLTIIGGVLLLIMTKKRRVGIFLITQTLIFSALAVYVVVYRKKFDGILKFTLRNVRNFEYTRNFYAFYVTTYTRMGPYLLGMMAAFITKLLKENSYNFSRKATTLILVPTFVFGTGFSYYGSKFYRSNEEYVPLENAIYGSLQRILYTLPYACLLCIYFTSGLGFFSKLLDKKIFIYGGRLVYCAYIIGPLFQTFLTMTQRTFMPVPGKLVGGIFAGMTYHMGKWDECFKAVPSSFKRQYCLAELNYNFTVDDEADPNTFNWNDWPQEHLSVWSVLKMYERDSARANRQMLFWASNVFHHRVEL